MARATIGRTTGNLWHRLRIQLRPPSTIAHCKRLQRSFSFHGGTPDSDFLQAKLGIPHVSNKDFYFFQGVHSLKFFHNHFNYTLYHKRHVSPHLFLVRLQEDQNQLKSYDLGKMSAFRPLDPHPNNLHYGGRSKGMKLKHVSWPSWLEFEKHSSHMTQVSSAWQSRQDHTISPGLSSIHTFELSWHHASPWMQGRVMNPIPRHTPQHYLTVLSSRKKAVSNKDGHESLEGQSLLQLQMALDFLKLMKALAIASPRQCG